MRCAMTLLGRYGGWLALAGLLCAASARAQWPLVWDLAGRGDDPVAAQFGTDGDLRVLMHARPQGSSNSHAVLLRIDPDGQRVWTAEDPALLDPMAFALRGDGEALLLGRIRSTVRITAIDAQGHLRWSHTRSGLDNSNPDFGPHAVPVWDEHGAAWRIPAGIGGDFAVISYSDGGDALPDRLWSPPVGTARATSVLPHAEGGLLISGSAALLPAPPGWWTVALDATGAEVWSHFGGGDDGGGLFSGSFLLSSDPVRVWANRETLCGVFSLRLWSIDAASGAPLWASRWPPADPSTPCQSMTPHSVVLAGDRVLAAGTANVFAPSSTIESVALSFDAGTGALLWARDFSGGSTAIRAQVAFSEGGVLLASSLFPAPGEAIPLWLSAWSRDGTACAEPALLLPARVLTVLSHPDAGLFVIGTQFTASTAEDLIVQRADDPCPWRFADGFESAVDDGTR